MSEDAYKRRLRERKRRITDSLKSDGYRVHPCEGTFHLFAFRGRNARAIRISFGIIHYDEVNVVRMEPVPDRCVRELWKVSEDGREVTIAKIVKGELLPTPPKPSDK